MPVKPSAVYTVAANANYSGGAAAGFPTKSATVSATDGFFPDTPIAAEESNYLFNISGQWSAWQFAGTSTPVIDTTIVERDSLGRSQFAICQTGNTASASSSLIVDSNPGQPAGDPSALFSNTITGGAISASNNGSSVCIDANNAGAGGGVQGSTVDGPWGVRGLSSNSAGGSVGVVGEARTASSVGVGGVGFGDPGSLPAVTGSLNAVDGVGVQGFTLNAAATTLSAAVEGNSAISADGTAVRGVSDGGYAVVAQARTAAPLRAALRLSPQDADPVSAFDGDEYHNSAGYRRVFADSIWRSVSTQEGNSVRGFDSDPGPVALPLAPVTAASVSLGINNAPLVIGELEILAEFEPAWGVSGAGVIQDVTARVRDVTAGVDVWSQIVALPDGLANIPVRTFSRTVTYTVPATGPRDFELILERTGGPTDALARNVVLKVSGVY